MLVDKVLVRELVAVDADAARAVALATDKLRQRHVLNIRVSTLGHLQKVSALSQSDC